VRGKKVLLLLVALGFLVFPAAFSSAQTNQKGIQISPLTYNFEIQPGGSQTAKITLTNRNDEILNFIMETEDFAAVSEEGAPSFTVTPKKEGVTTLADWIAFPSVKEGAIEPKGEKEITFAINIPQQAEPGGHYAAVFAKEVKKTPEGKTEIGVASRVGTLLLISVPGLVTKTAEITEFSPPKFVWRGPVDLKMKVQNTGSVHYDSLAQVVLKPLWGKEGTVEMGTHTIIPKSIRSYEGKWDKRYPLGYYRLKATAQDGDKGEVEKSATLIAIPLEIAVPVLVVLIIILIVIKYVRRHYKVIANQPPGGPPAAVEPLAPSSPPSKPSSSPDLEQGTPAGEPAESAGESEPPVAPESPTDEENTPTESAEEELSGPDSVSAAPTTGGSVGAPTESAGDESSKPDLAPAKPSEGERSPLPDENAASETLEDGSLPEQTAQPSEPSSSPDLEQGTLPADEVPADQSPASAANPPEPTAPPELPTDDEESAADAPTPDAYGRDVGEEPSKPDLVPAEPSEGENSLPDENAAPETSEDDSSPEQTAPVGEAPTEETTPPPSSTDDKPVSEPSTPTAGEVDEPGPTEADKPLENVIDEEENSTAPPKIRPPQSRGAKSE